LKQRQGKHKKKEGENTKGVRKKDREINTTIGIKKK
jgi:hypothetical protein